MQAPSATPKDVILQIKNIGFLPVFYHADVNAILQAIRISFKCGVRAFEFLHQRDNRGLRMFNWLVEETLDLKDLLLGAGTVLDAVMTQRYIDAGAKFIASPILRNDMAEVCQRTNTLWIPGCASQQDISTAHDLGAGAVMLLPGNVLGPDFLRAAVIEYPDLQFVPSGGIVATEESLRQWLAAGALGVRLNDPLFEREAITINDWTRVENNVSNVVRTVQRIRVSGKKNQAQTSLI
jgi:2-dehydro-3-deoxyphosphogluconate aldolase/(4S)-4-hydroxy-2-oxoglutarate aldolase